jgi:steroid delta-isomerase-like uncharacterized protein
MEFETRLTATSGANNDVMNANKTARTTSRNLALIRARYQAVNKHDTAKFQSFYSKSITWADPGLRTVLRGPVAVRKRLETFISAFPDLRWKLERIFSQDDKVCAEFTFSGTHRADFPSRDGSMTIPATNKRVRIRGCGVYTIKAGKIIDSKIYFDLGSLES